MAGFVNTKPLRAALVEVQNLLHRVAGAVSGELFVKFSSTPAVTATISGTPVVTVNNLPVTTVVDQHPMAISASNQTFNQFLSLTSV